MLIQPGESRHLALMLGEVLLDRINTGINKREVGFKRLRKMVLNQEQAHHCFGLRHLGKIVAAEPALQPRLRAHDYLALIADIIADFQDAYEFFDDDLGTFTADFQQGLPAWMTCTL